MIAFDIHTIQMLMSDIADRVYSLSTEPWGEGERDEPLHRLQKLTVQARADEHKFTQAMHQYRHYRPVRESERIVKRPEKPVQYLKQAQSLKRQLSVDKRIPIAVGVAAITAFALCERARDFLNEGDIGGAFDLYQDALKHKAVLDGVQGAHHNMQIVADNARKASYKKRERQDPHRENAKRLYKEADKTNPDWRQTLMHAFCDLYGIKDKAAYKRIKQLENNT